MPLRKGTDSRSKDSRSKRYPQRHGSMITLRRQARCSARKLGIAPRANLAASPLDQIHVSSLASLVLTTTNHQPTTSFPNQSSAVQCPFSRYG